MRTSLKRGALALLALNTLGMSDCQRVLGDTSKVGPSAPKEQNTPPAAPAVLTGHQNARPPEREPTAPDPFR
jgi:hypothetical protein